MPHIDWFKSLVIRDLMEAVMAKIVFPRYSSLILLEIPPREELIKWKSSPQEIGNALSYVARRYPYHEFLAVGDPDETWGPIIRYAGNPPNVTFGLMAATQSHIHACYNFACAMEARALPVVLILNPTERILLPDNHVFKGVWVRHLPGSPKPYPFVSDLEADLAIDGVPYWIDHTATHHTDGKFFSLFDKDTQ